MRAVAYQECLPISDPGALVDVDLPEPAPSGRDLLVSVRAVSGNPVDTKVRRGVSPAPGVWKVLGWDAAGTVVSTTLQIDGVDYPADWYLPNGTATGLMLLQHGFSRGCGNLRNTSKAVMEKGLMVLCLNADMSGGNPKLAEALAGELVDLVAVVVDLVRDQQRLEPRGVCDGLEHLVHVLLVLRGALGTRCAVGLLYGGSEQNNGAAVL